MSPNPSPQPNSSDVPRTQDEARTLAAANGWCDPDHYGEHLHHFAHVEATHHHQAEGCAVAEAAIGRVAVADAWRLIATGHQVQAERYRTLAGAYA